MKIRKDMIFAILTTFCLSALMFAVIPIRGGLPYDPWSDIDDSGKIDMKDIGNVAARFMTSGDSAKNVTIAGHANKLAYTNSTTVSGNSYFLTPFISVDGYSKVTICIYNTATNNFYRLSTYHFESASSFYVDTATDFGNDLVKTYDVPNQQIRVRFDNNDGNSRNLHIDVYLIP